MSTTNRRIRSFGRGLAGAVAVVGLTAAACEPMPPAGVNPIPLPPESPEISLADRVAGYESLLPEFDTGLGIYVGTGRSPHTGATNVEIVGDLNHSLIDTANVASAAALQHRSSGDAGSLARMERALEGLHAAVSISRESANVLPGFGDLPYLARWVGPRTWPNAAFLDSWPDGCYYGAGRCPTETGTSFGDVQWISDSSGDVHINWFSAMGMLHEELDDPALLGMIETDVAELTDRLIQTDFNIIDPVDGQPTLYSAIQGVHKLAILATAHSVTGDQTYRDLYLNDLVSWAAMPILSESSIFEYHNYFNIALTEISFFNAIRLETNASRRSTLVEIYRTHVRSVTASDHQALFDAFAVFNGVDTPTVASAQIPAVLEGFGEAPRRAGTETPYPAGVPRDPTSVTLALVDGFFEQSLHPNPSQYRCIEANVWTRTSHRLGCSTEYGEWIGSDQRWMASSADLVFAYWMGRTAGVVDPSD